MTVAKYRAEYTGSERLLTLGQRLLLVPKIGGDAQYLESQKWNQEERELLEQLVTEFPDLAETPLSLRVEINNLVDETFTKK